MWSKDKKLFLMPCLFAAFGICHRSHSPLCSLFQIPKPTKIQVKIDQLILSPLLTKQSYVFPLNITIVSGLFLLAHIVLCRFGIAKRTGRGMLLSSSCSFFFILSLFHQCRDDGTQRRSDGAKAHDFAEGHSLTLFLHRNDDFTSGQNVFCRFHSGDRTVHLNGKHAFFACRRTDGCRFAHQDRSVAAHS